MVIEFHCPHCEVRLKAGENLAGKSGTCPNCNKEIQVPEAATTDEGSDTTDEASETTEENSEATAQSGKQKDDESVS
ncbi:MAG TPA: hypothetical protein ENN87_04740 [Phycisphaerales bacterium]|nr:hypothetical protein [Phycisphaerales bacterium]